MSIYRSRDLALAYWCTNEHRNRFLYLWFRRMASRVDWQFSQKSILQNAIFKKWQLKKWIFIFGAFLRGSQKCLIPTCFIFKIFCCKHWHIDKNRSTNSDLLKNEVWFYRNRFVRIPISSCMFFGKLFFLLYLVIHYQTM
jgi:hypothetical protein